MRVILSSLYVLFIFFKHSGPFVSGDADCSCAELSELRVETCRSERLKADLGLLFVALVWGATFPVVKVALIYIPPFTFNTFRFFLSSAIFLLYFIRRDSLKFLRVARASFREGVKIGSVVFLGYSLQTLGLNVTTATNAGFITSLYVVLTPVVSWVFYRTGIKGKDIFCTALALFGMLLLSFTPGISTEVGDILLLGCAIAFAAEIAMISHHSRHCNPDALAFWQIASVALFSLPFSFSEGAIFHPTLNCTVIVSLLITAIFATVIARILQNRLQRITSPADAAVIFSMEGVFSHVFSALTLGEILTPMQYAGALAIVMAVIISSL